MGVNAKRTIFAVGIAIGLFVGGNAVAKEVDVEFDFNRMGRIASNQVAVWIEDSDGRHVRTLFVTDFTARRRGYRIRLAALPAWVRSYEPAARPAQEVDAVSHATPGNGRVRLTWDCKNSNNEPVPPGTYSVRIEGNIFWEEIVYFSAGIEVGGEGTTVEPAPVYTSDEAAADIPLISSVVVTYHP